jgi:lipopolysaccharide export system permease protein
MRIFTRHILIELSKVFLLSITSLTLFMLIVGVVREGISEHLPLSELMRLIPYILPDALRVTLPVTLLLATTTVYSRMSGFNEVVALKALGVSPVAILWPAYFLAFLLSLVTVYLNDVAVSWGRNGVQRVVTEAVEKIAYNMLATQREYTCSRFSIFVKRVEGRRLIGVRLSVQAQGDNPPGMITAREAQLQSDPERNVLKITLYNGALTYQGKLSYQFPDVEAIEVPLRDRVNESEALLPSWLELSVIAGQTQKQEEQIRIYKQEMAVRSAYSLLSGDFIDLASSGWPHYRNTLQVFYSTYHRLLTEPHRRWATGFSCLFFVWVGAPLAIQMRNSDLLASFALCFLPILIVYYPLLVFGVDGAKHGTIPPWSIWAGNVLLALWGLAILRKVLRY